MKNLKEVILLGLALLAPVLCFSQTDKVIFDVGRIHIRNSYTKAEIVSQWGEPSRYSQHDSEFGLDEYYEYGKNSFNFNKGYMTSFTLRDSRFPIFTSHISGGIKVGDPITRFSKLTFGTLSLKENARKFHFQIGMADDGIEVSADENGIITVLLFQETN